MKQTLVIDIHSVLDVITNSSSELFVVSDNTIEAVREMLEYMLDQWNEMAAKGVFGTYHIRNERTSLKEGKKSLEPLKKWDDVFGDIRIMDRSELDDYQGWGYQNSGNIGKIIIESAEDNSIPGEIMEWIESAFSAQRHHLG